ncbi:hypothetical protein BsWGS_04451 [Bradybaena similaris]
MSGKEGKRQKERRNLHAQTKNVLSPTIVTNPVVSQPMEITVDGSAQQQFEQSFNSLQVRVSDSSEDFNCTPKYLFDDAERITELMDAPAELDIPPHSISRGPNPYLDRCIYCNSPRGEFQEYEKGIELIDVQLPDNSLVNGSVNHSFSSLKMEIWICANCRKIAGNFQSIWEEHFPQPYSLPVLHDKACTDPVSCVKCQEECEAIEKEEIEMEQNEIELCFLVKDFYSCEELVFSHEQEDRLSFLVDKLCSRDTHQLFLQLETHVQDIVLGIKTNLLVRLKERDLVASELALNFTNSLLSHYDLFTKKACLFAQYLGELNEHLLELKLTWELLNKHVFHSVVYSDPVISSCRPSMLEQLRQCSVQFEKSADNPYTSAFHRLLKIQEEMSVVVILWRECQELIENYSQKEIMRQFLRKHCVKDPSINEALSENARNSLSQQASADNVECHNCNPEREEFGDVFLGCGSRQDQTASVNEDANTDDLDDSPGDYYEDADEDYNADNRDIGFGDVQSVEIPVCELKSTDAVWEAIQQHHKLLQQQQLLIGTPHSCPHCKQARHAQQCPFQTKAGPDLIQQVNGQLSKSDEIPDTGNHCTEALADVNSTTGGNGAVTPGVCTTCQCHACLKQSGHVISASLPLQIPVFAPPGELHLYPHIHGLPQQQQQHYLLDLPPPLLPPIKLPVKLDFDNHHGLQGHLSCVYSDWENTVPESVTAQHNHQHHQHHQHLSDISADHFHPPHMATSASPFNLDLAFHLASHNMHTSSTNTTSVFKTVASKPVLASSILSTLHSAGHVPPEGSSVDPSHPLDFLSHSKIPYSCVNQTSSLPSCSFSSHSCFCPSVTTASSISVPAVSMASAVPQSSASCHSPSCSRLTQVSDNTSSSKWERSQHCRKFNPGNKPVTAVQSQQSQQTIGTQPLSDALQGPSLTTLPDVLKNFNFTPKHINQPGHPPSPRPTEHRTNMVHCASSTAASVPTAAASSVPVSCSNSLSAMVTNIDVGTSTPCTDPDCEAHYEENCDSIDDSCSEKSSGTSTSNQKEGKYCDCCYCEFFGHNNTQVPRVSTNYIEMKDRLRKKLKKRQSENKHKQEVPNDGFTQEGSKEELDPLEKRGLDGLLSFINGTDKECPEKVTDKEITAKAAKRARQKQRKLEAKATQAKSSSPVDTHHHPEPQNSSGQQSLNHNLNAYTDPHQDTKLNTVKSKSKKVPPETNMTNNALNDLVTKHASSPLSKQEINRSSLIIQSTRSTFSFSQKHVDTNVGSQQNLSDSNIESPEHMIQFLNALQQYHHQGKKHEPASLCAVNTSNHTFADQATSYKLDSTSLQVKSSKGVNKVNDVVKQQQNGHYDQPQQLSNQQKQQEPAKSVNGTVIVSSQPSRIGNQVRTSGSGNTLNLRCEAQTLSDAHGKPGQSSTVAAKLVMPATSAAVHSVTSQSSLVINSSAGSCSKTSQPAVNGAKAPLDQGKTNGKTKKTKKKNRNGYVTGVDEIFMPKSESELEGDVDDFERELEEFKRFCFEPAEPKERRKMAVNVNLKDIFKKKAAVV